MPEHADLIRDLAELGRSMPTPDVPGLEGDVMNRICEPSRRPARFAGPRARLVVAAVAVLLALLATPPVRAAVADWFGFGSVVVHRGDSDGTSPPGGPASPPPVSTGTSLAEAAAQVDFVVFELPSLGEPAGAEVFRDRRVLSAGWTGGIRLDQSSSLGYTFDKTAVSVQRVTVKGREAIWFEDSHQVVLLDEQGARIPDTRRTAGRTLIWTVDETTLRLEGNLTLDRALEIAQSARPFR